MQVHSWREHCVLALLFILSLLGMLVDRVIKLLMSDSASLTLRQ